VRSEWWYVSLCCQSFGGPGECVRVDHPAGLVAEHEIEFLPGGPGKEPFGVRPELVMPVRSDNNSKRRVEQVTGLPFAFELAVA